MPKHTPTHGRIMDRIRRLEDGCWLYERALRKGYPSISDNGKTKAVHRLMWEYSNGPIPSGLQLDHLCRVRCCVRPGHLRLVTIRENVLAAGSLSRTKKNADAVACTRGHSFDASNTYLVRGHRHCRECCRVAWRAYYKRKSAKEARLDAGMGEWEWLQ
jgi:hypothetical protein